MIFWIMGILVICLLTILIYACCVISGRDKCADCLFRLECEKSGYKCFMKENEE